MRRALTLAVLALATVAARAAAHEAHVGVAPGERLRVVERGAGPAVVLVPGLLGSAYGFRKLSARLDEIGHRVVVVEPLGYGGSTRPRSADYSLTAQADRIALVLDAIGVADAVVVGHAGGASIALRLAYRHPERVRAVVSLDGGPAEAAATPGVRRALRFAFLLDLFGGTGRIRRAVGATLRERSADPSWVTEDVLDRYVAAAGPGGSETLEALRLMAKAHEPELLVPKLGAVRCPVRLVVGDRTPPARGVTDDEIAVLARGLDEFGVDRLPRAGHFLAEEAPDAVAAVVQAAWTRGAPRSLASARPGR